MGAGRRTRETHDRKVLGRHTHIDIGGNVRFLYRDSADEIYENLVTLIENESELQKMQSAADNGMKHFSYRQISRRYIP